MRDSIRLSEKHGLNPCMGICFYCGQEDGSIGLVGRLPNDAEAPRRAVISMRPCSECQKLMGQGCMLIEVKDTPEGPKGPRTGRMWVVRDSAIERIFDKPLANDVIKRRFAMIPEEAAKKLGLHKVENEEYEEPERWDGQS